MKQLQHTSETSETLETYSCNTCFHRNISLLRLRIIAAISSAAAMTFRWGTVASVAPRLHLSNTPVCTGDGHGAQQQGARWGSHSALDGVHGGEDGSSERMTQQHAMGKSRDENRSDTDGYR
jgi:hypothetical protein